MQSPVLNLKYAFPGIGALSAYGYWLDYDDPEDSRPFEFAFSTQTAGLRFDGSRPVSDNLNFLYTAGIAGSKFYDELAKGKLTATYCASCDSVFLPATAFCEKCMVGLDPEKDARSVDPKSGMIIGCTVVHEDRSGHPLDQPKVVVQVAFPGTVGTVFGTLEIDDPDEAEIGMGVTLIKAKATGPEHVVFKPSQ